MRPRRPDMESAIALYCVAPDQPQPPALPPPEPIALFNPEYALPKCPSLLPYQDKILHGFRGDGEKRAEWFAALIVAGPAQFVSRKPATMRSACRYAWQNAQLTDHYACARLGLLGAAQALVLPCVVTICEKTVCPVERKAICATSQKALKTALGDAGDDAGSMPCPCTLDWEAMCGEGNGQRPL
jgi:hypothetical protein